MLIDRVEFAIRRGLIDLIPDDMACESLDFTVAELAMLLFILFPEEYASPIRSPKPTKTAPGSAERIAEYARRVKKKRKMFSPDDASADGPGRGLRVVQRSNGNGLRVLGWEDEVSEEDAKNVQPVGRPQLADFEEDD